MRVCASLDDARTLSGVVAIEAGSQIVAYMQGDALPSHLQPPPPSTVPLEVTMRQARLALAQVGKLAAVSTVIAGMTEPQKTATQIWWEYSGTVQRSQPLVGQLGTAIGLTPAEVDQLFITASTL